MKLGPEAENRRFVGAVGTGDAGSGAGGGGGPGTVGGGASSPPQAPIRIPVTTKRPSRRAPRRLDPSRRMPSAKRPSTLRPIVSGRPQRGAQPGYAASWSTPDSIWNTRSQLAATCELWLPITAVSP